MIFMDWVETQK